MSSTQRLDLHLLKPQKPQRPGDKIQWGNANGTAGVLAIAELACQLTSSSVVIAQNMAEADRLEQDLEELLKGVPNAPQLVHFSDWETLPYDTFSPHQDIISARMRTLYQLALDERCLIVVTAATLMQRIAPASYILGNSLVVAKGDTLQLEKLQANLVDAGYNKVDSVFQHGEFALRGALIDIFPMGSDDAYRIELFDDEVDTLRTFDPESQRTIEHVERIELLPAKECPLDTHAISRFKSQWHDAFDVDHRACPVYRSVNDGQSPAGVEYYLPLFFEETASLLDYLPKDSTLFITGELDVAIENFWRDVNNRYNSRSGDRLNPVLPPAKVCLPVNELYLQLKPFSRVTLTDARLEAKVGQSNLRVLPLPQLSIDDRAQEPLNALHSFLLDFKGRVLFGAETNGRREILLEQFKTISQNPIEVANIATFFNNASKSAITIGNWERGFILEDRSLAVIPEAALFGQRIKQARRRKKNATDQDAVIKNLTELKMGAPVVHIDHGVGRYRGLEAIEIDGSCDEFLLLEYANEAKLYVPVGNLHVISRYSGGEEHAPLHRLGTDQWRNAKRKAAEQIRDVAAELLVIYAKRQARAGHKFDNPKDALRQFAASFPFEETPDQEQAINAVRSDMLSPQPMDRLVCGDVGFGKTEVAMRAAFIAVQNSKQVAILVPTTLLAQQHYENFKDRFADWPVNVEVLSRFRTGKQTTETQKRITDGKVDIVIGTHKLLSKDMSFPKLGLLIIDEEHRFGVRQKEAIKALRAEVDILTMTATPIPRTLNMAMNGIRDLSIIATPPAKRLSVKTFVRQSDPNIIKEAILREILRGGQVYVLHNEVSTIEKVARDIAELVPEAKVDIGHGQMRERELEAVMSDFYHKRFNVLVCTTIIETGIDVPNANTMIIERADKFGLAQLHQLRGRVGRSHHQAYAYLLTPPPKTLTADAQKRLAAIEEAQDLGAGFTLASHDLEIRGAGELLGDEQSGQIQAIGFSLYMDMLDRAVKAIQNGEEIDIEKPEQSGCEINLRIPALIPDDYLPDVNNRLILYKRIASIQNSSDSDDLQVEMIDRFGLLPEAVKNLFRITTFKLQAQKLGIVKIEASSISGKIEFDEKPNVDPMTIIQMVQRQPQNYQLDGANKLKFIDDMPSAAERLERVQKMLDALT
ncbi:transcription-repair coupling factor [Marinagarivorans cellulosilyticus]|uniref:Transcription-repair-coupling factor n=1 Tax=Marinagarivorans cellulosilyticus TaxID=2721545 RepID=A0AAN1WET5_9GAMM|nr:transcription-repair coupling factor [Marinagarivorans cellulosilyticus]BCD96280.1 transcription-repair coupling factor [Marinagarivorans cellulosilyticus]